MKILVTGGAGFIGSAVVRKALKIGHEIINIDKLTYAASLDSLSSVEGSPKYTFIQEDICNRNALDNILNQYQPDCIMHLAAESHVDRSIDSPESFINTNILGTYHLLEASLEYWFNNKKSDNFRFHHISTDEVFGSLPANKHEKFNEKTPYDPRSPYSASKASSDHLVRAWHKTFGLPILLTNCSNNYGPFHFPEKLIPTVILKAILGEPIPVYGSGEQIRDWLYVEDHAEALLLVLSKGKIGRSYNIGSNNECKNIDLVHKICEILDNRIPKSNSSYFEQITFVDDRPGHDARYAIDASRIRQELSWVPKVSFEEGLNTTVQWYLDNETWWRDILNKKGIGKRLGLKK